jgi:hypothetical protein
VFGRQHAAIANAVRNCTVSVNNLIYPSNTTIGGGNCQNVNSILWTPPRQPVPLRWPMLRDAMWLLHPKCAPFKHQPRPVSGRCTATVLTFP